MPPCPPRLTHPPPCPPVFAPTLTGAAVLVPPMPTPQPQPSHPPLIPHDTLIGSSPCRCPLGKPGGTVF
eukprot:scaffold9552_cov113-Isochrysis_galbana.AAC.1